MGNNFIDDFFTEAMEHLSHVEDDILALEQEHEVDEEIINRLFRAIHTIKGGAGFLELFKISTLAHHLENILGRIRDKQLTPLEEVTEALLNGTDTLISLIRNNNDETISIEPDLEALNSLLGEGESIGDDEITRRNKCKSEDLSSTFNLASYNFRPSEEEGHSVYVIVIDLINECIKKERQGFELIEFVNSVGIFYDSTIPLDTETIRINDNSEKNELHCSLLFSTVIDEVPLIEVGADITILSYMRIPPSKISSYQCNEKDTTTPKEVSKNKSIPAAEATPIAKKSSQDKPPAPHYSTSSTKSKSSQFTDQSIRISLSLLDEIMGLAGELVLIRNQNMQAVATGNMQKITAINKQLNKVTTELHTSIMRTRMRPVGGVFSRFTRVVRDLAKKLGKEVVLEIIGSEVELDKTIVETIADPLTHLIRNAVDHGIESPDQREQAGKPRKGNLILKASHTTGQVSIQVTDDGKGIDPDALRRSALKKGLLTNEQAESLSDDEALNLIFSPGFSTAENVTDISGRGVGMDVVKSAFQKIGGTFAIASDIGAGTTITIQMPLTLAILPSLIIAVEKCHFAIPQSNIEEVVWLYGEEAYQNIKVINEREVFRLRGKFIPLLQLSKLLNIKKHYRHPTTGERLEERRKQFVDRRVQELPSAGELRSGERERRQSLDNSIHIILLKNANNRFGLLVDTVVDSEEIVVRALHKQLKNHRPYSGTAVLGNGAIALILDVGMLADLGTIRPLEAGPSSVVPVRKTAESQNILLFSVGKNEQFALPLNLITRVEEVNRDAVQTVDNRDYIHYRNQLIPLIYLDRALPSLESVYDKETLCLIIPRSPRPIAIVAATILDTIDIICDLDTTTIHHPGIVGTLFIGSKLTLFIDIFEIIEAIEPGWFSTHLSENKFAKNVLLVEDSTFYLTMLRSYLRGIGANVTSAHNGKEALDLIKRKTFDGVISDIEMPIMNGFEFARALRLQPELQTIPLLAISSKDDSAYREEARNAGFDAFRTKYDMDGMLDLVQKLFKSEKRI